MEIDYIALGKRVKKLRKEQKMTQEKLAELIDVSVPHMSNIENGKTKFSLQVLVDMADALKTTPDALMMDQVDDQIRTRGMIIEEIGRELSDCTPVQITTLEEVVRNTKNILKQYESRLKNQEE